MNRKYIILLAIIVIAVLAFFSLVIPKGAANIYTSALQTASLFVGFILALKVSTNYSKELKKSFIFLSLFLLLYMITSPLILWKYLSSTLGNYYIFLVLVLQAATYAMLITSCVYIVRVIEVRRINRYGWIVLGLLCAFCIFIIIKGVPEMRQGLSTYPTGSISSMFIRIFDMSVILMLVPVLLLYLQHVRAKAQESITFTMIMCGLIIGILSTYIFEIATGMSIRDIAEQFVQKGSVLDVVNIFGYLLIATGLYAHLKYDEWGYRMIEKAIG